METKKQKDTQSGNTVCYIEISFYLVVAAPKPPGHTESVRAVFSLCLHERLLQYFLSIGFHIVMVTGR